MEFVRKIVDASSLLKIIQLPDTLMHRKLEIIVLPVDDSQKETVQENMTVSDITIEEMKEERLKK